jgi:voltage-gated potassium channel
VSTKAPPPAPKHGRAKRRTAGTEDAPLLARVRAALIAFAGLAALGAASFYLLSGGRWTPGEAFYFAINAVSTTGFREAAGVGEVPYVNLATGILIVLGLGVVAYFQSTLTALLVEGALTRRFKERRMQNRIEGLREHIVVAGAGSTGVHVVEELFLTGTPFVVIDRHREVLERIALELTGGKMLYVVGDATEDAVLLEAGITHCRGVVAALTEDKDNLFVTLSARSLNANARIVAKVIGADAAPKMIRAGANATVSPNMMGGRQLASEITRPVVVEFIDKMLRHKDQVLRLEEVVIPEASFFIGRTLMEVPIRSETKLLVVALHVGESFVYNPEPSTILEAGSVLVVLGETKNVTKLRQLVKHKHAPPVPPRSAE